MSTSIIFSDQLPPAPARIFFIGLGGIGMSALAQLLVHLGYKVGGSDRGLNEPARQQLFSQLSAQGISVYPQDGSGPREFAPDAMLLSAAIEAGNADLEAAPGVPCIHRATAMALAFRQLGIPQIAVAGSCGKTSVTGWIASALRALGKRVLMVNGGYTLEFESDAAPGNFHADKNPEYIVAEIDESDRSINVCNPDYGAVLNVGDDHYSMEELQQVFGAFLGRCRKGAVVPADLTALLPADAASPATFAPAASGYSSSREGISFSPAPGITAESQLSGRHNAVNGSAVWTILKSIFPEADGGTLAAALRPYRGVRQRFETMRNAGEGIPAVINDYAHNPEKIAAAVETARERFGSPLDVVFQPHGYGPLGFMREGLAHNLLQALHPGDRFIFLPVYYAGGTTSFKPTSQEVAESFRTMGINAFAAESRDEAVEMLQERCAGAWLILGARDPSLREWTKEISASPWHA